MIWLIWTVFTLFAASCSCQYAWPAPASIRHFVVMDDVTGLRDVAQNEDPYRINTTAQHDSNRAGPFGELGSSYTVSSRGFICDLNRHIFSPTVTYALYFLTSATEKDGAIIEDFSEQSRFLVSYNGRTLEMRTAYPNSTTQSKVTKSKFFTAGQWTFIVLTYDIIQQTLKLFDETGQLIQSWSGFAMVPREKSWLYLGHNWFDGTDRKMYPSDSMACVFQYNTILSPAEISQLPSVCQSKGRPNVEIAPWPYPGDLLGLWPLSKAFGTADIGPHQFPPRSTSVNIAGPFGGEHTATKATKSQTEVMQEISSKLSTNLFSFTVAFFFKAKSSSGQGGLFEFVDKDGKSKTFQLRYNNLTVEASADGKTFGYYDMVQPQSTWTFVAFSFDHPARLLTVFSQYGVFSPAKFQPDVHFSNSLNNNGVRLGHATHWNQGPSAKDGFACLAVYSRALKWPDVKQLIQACRTINSEPLAGQPKLPLAPFPETSGQTVIPKAGQFPTVASLRLNYRHICSASILTPFWVLSNARCFDETSDPGSYFVVVGVYDLKVDEANQVLHEVSKIVFSGKSARDVALVQLSTPIDFRSDYVSDAYVHTGLEGDSITWLEDIRYFTGWGINGRPAFISQTIPRTVGLELQTDAQCWECWLDDYEPGVDLCFENESPDKNIPCHGDQGGPAYVGVAADENLGTGDRLMQIGMYYGRDVSCSAEKPGLFVSLARYATWIQENIACSVPNVNNPPECPQ